MINKITVSERRGLFPQYSNLGTIGEKNATTLLFLLPSSLQGYSENIVCETAQGSFNYTVSNDTFDLPSEVLTDSTLKLQLVLKDGDKVVWKSIPYTFTLFPTLDFGKNIFTELVEAASKLFGEDLTGVTISDIVKRIAAAKLLNAGDVTVDGVYGSDTVINPPEGKNAISKVTVKALEPKELTVRRNGLYPDTIQAENPDGTLPPPEYWTRVYVNVPSIRLIPTNFAVEPALETKKYTYLDSDEFTTGYSFNCIGELTVKAVTAAIDSNIKPENIVDGVTILGVAGSAVVGDTEELTYLLSGLENIFEQEAVV